jgi:pimeloyl-ACP methyl ester carboxylesterase
MDVILVPGLWLDASSWDALVPALRAGGHTPHPLTLPGVGASGSESAEIGIADWVGAVVDEIDRHDPGVVLVGHSGGGNVVWGAAEARPDRVARVVFVDTMPPPPRSEIAEFPVVDGVVPFPGWEFFDEPDIADLDDATRVVVERSARTVPARVPTDRLELTGTARHRIPVTILSGQFDAEALPAMLAEWGPWADEYAALTDVEVVHLDSGHWPQFSQPERFAEALTAAIR